MAWATGTATNYLDLLSKLETFLTSNSTLVGLGQNWTTQRYSAGVAPTTFTGRIAFGSPTNANTFLDAQPGVLPATYYKAKIFGTLTAPLTGDYTFGIDADDCVDLLIDGNLVAGWYGSHAGADAFTHNETVNLTSGTHTFEIRFLQSSGNYGVSLGWQKPGDGSIAIIPAGSLSSMQLQWSAYAGSMPNNTSEMDGLWAEKELVIKAPGLSGTENIYVGIQPYKNVTGDYYNWKVMGAVGYAPTLDFDNQPYKSTNAIIYLWNDPMTYWFIANGNRCIVVAKVDTIYQIMYLGKFLPYFLPTQYPYPVLACGTHTSTTSRWSAYNHDFSSIFSPGAGCFMYYIDGTWKQVRNRYNNGGWYNWDDGQVNVWPTSSNNNFRGNSLAWPDGGYTLLPLVLESGAPNNVLGEIDGIYWVSGHQNSSENVITVSGQNYLVVQDVWKTARDEYMAIKLA